MCQEKIAGMAKKILIIEDEPDILVYLVAVLEDHGFAPFTIETGDRSPLVDAVMAVSPDVIILDVMMPQRSGISIYRELRSCDELKSIPVAIMSGFTPQNGNVISGFQQMLPDGGIEAPDGFIDKPIDVKALVALVMNLTRKELRS